MMIKLRRTALPVMIAAALVGGQLTLTSGAAAQSSTFSPEQRLEIEQIIEAVVLERFSGGAAESAATLIDATDPERIRGVASIYGATELSEDLRGNPLLSGEIDETRYEIFFYGCADGAACKNVMFRSAWREHGATESDAMRWNREKRFGKAYIDQAGNLVIEMNVNLSFGVSQENLVDTFDWWRVVLSEFSQSFDLN